MNSKTRVKADKLYLLLGALFITALVVCNLIANKFVSVDLGFYIFTISAGVLPYPITFLITDVLSEVYGQKKNQSSCHFRVRSTCLHHVYTLGWRAIQCDRNLTGQ